MFAWTKALASRIQAWLSPREIDHDFQQELDSHLESLTNENIRRGMSPDEAVRAARIRLGGFTQLSETNRELRGLPFLETFFQDIRFASRMLRKSPGFTAVAVLTLALGIGANTAIFSLLNAIVLKTLPVANPESLVVLASYSRSGRIGDFGYQDYLVLRDSNRSFSGVLAASNPALIDVGSGGETDSALRKIVSANYFSVLGVQPALGRVFNNEDENLQVVIISDRFWKRSFAGSPEVIGKQIDLVGQPFTIVGVAPSEFLGETVGEAPDIWASMSLMPASQRSLPGYTWLNLMARLNPTVNPQRASADMGLLLPQVPNSAARGGFIERIAVESGGRGGSGLRNTFSAPLSILMTVVAVVLLIACANLASLLLARGAAREKEIATRLALGASRSRIVRQLTTESVVLALFGGALGLLFAVWSDRLLLGLVGGVGRVITVDLHPDFRILAFTGLISVATGVLFGLAPAFHSLRQGSLGGLKLNAHASAGGGRRWGLKDGLVAIQVALSLILLVVSGLFIRTIQNLKTQDVGFHAANVLSVQVGAERGHPQPSAIVIAPLMSRVESVPGVQAGSFSFTPTLANNGSGVNGLKFNGYAQTTEDQRAAANWVGPRYFETSGIPLLEGREFSLADNSNAQKVAILNQTMARKYFGNRSAIGEQFEFNKEEYRIVGVAKDAKYLDLRQSNIPFVYFAALQTNSEITSLELRTTISPLALAPAIRDAIEQADPQLRIREITTLEKRIDQKMAREFLVADIAGFFSGLTLFLVSIGIFGTLAFTVARRTNEIGIRMALGAQSISVLGMLLGDVMRVLVLGLAAGTAAALALTRFLSSLLYHVKPADPLTYLAVSVLLTVVALLASYIPARRATRIDPMLALREE
jgi:predicted permease